METQTLHELAPVYQQLPPWLYAALVVVATLAIIGSNFWRDHIQRVKDAARSALAEKRHDELVDDMRASNAAHLNDLRTLMQAHEQMIWR